MQNIRNDWTHVGFWAKFPYADGALLSRNIPCMLQNIRDGVFFDSFLSLVCVLPDGRRRRWIPRCGLIMRQAVINVFALIAFGGY